MANSLFAIQVFLPLGTISAEALRKQLRKLILDAPENEQRSEKRRMYEAIVRALVGNSEQFSVGVWDYSDDADEAETEYRHWCEGTEADSKAREQSGDTGAGPRSMFVTMAFLLDADGACAQQFAEASDVPERDLWKRSTFLKLLQLIPLLDFASVSEDAVYLCPGDREHGLTEEELRDEEYDYLHEIG